MKQLDQSFIIGIFGLIGLFIGLFVKNIMVWTFVGIAVGYVITFCNLDLKGNMNLNGQLL